MTRGRKFALALVGTLVLGVAGVAWANWAVENATAARIFTDVAKVPARRVGLVLGTSPRSHGRPNLFFVRRLDAAAKLFKAGKVNCLLVSGDHGTRYYDEVDAMRQGLIQRGVPGSRICLDHAGFRTLDSLVRAHKVFGVTSAVIVTDGFHLPRSLYLADQNGIDAVGFSSMQDSQTDAHQPALREVGARTLMMIDLAVGRQPKFLGPHVELPN